MAGLTLPARTIFSVARRSLPRLLCSAFRNSPPLGRDRVLAAARFELLFFAEAGKATAPAPRGRSVLRALAVGFRIFTAPAGLSGRCRRAVQHSPYFLHEIFGQTGFGDERVTAGLLRAFQN